jgi:DMSO reductase anchor subunit
METLQEYIPLLIPLIAIQLVLMIVALLDLRRREKVRGSKWLWVLIIIFGEMIGPIVYFVVGRKEE